MIIYDGPIEDSQQLIQFFRNEADNLRALRKVIVSDEKTLVLDINKDGIEFPGLTYGSEVLERLLQELGIVFRPAILHDPTATSNGKKEYDISARWTWGHDRIL